jgi:hypothetical protein
MQEQHMGNLPVNTLNTHRWWSVKPSSCVINFKFLHTYCNKFPNGAYKGAGVYVLKSSYPLCYEFLHMFHVSMFGIINSLFGSREIC